MIVPVQVSERYDNARPYIDYVARIVKTTLLEYCDATGFAFTARAKTAESLAEKLETGRYTRWSDVDDLYACAIIVPTLSVEDEVIDFLSRAFSQVHIRRRGTTKKDPAVFRFDATRFIGRLRVSDPSSMNPGILNLSFEVQVRSAFEHAWSVTTHALAYKAERIDWKSIRLAAQLKAAVEQLDGLVLAFDQAAGVVSEHRWPEVDAKKELESFFRTAKENGLLPSEVVPSNWQRFTENCFAFLRSGRGNERKPPAELVTRATGVLDVELKNVSGKFPRSISLLQFCIGVLATAGTVPNPLHRYVPLVTQSLRDLYPAVTSYAQIFDFEGGAT